MRRGNYTPAHCLASCVLHRYILEKGQVALVPGDAFGAPDCLRMSYATSLEQLGKALDRLEKVLQASNFSGRAAAQSVASARQPCL